MELFRPEKSLVLGDGWAVIEDVGGRATMEDRYLAGAEVSKGILLFGVFDGHNGESVAEYCTTNLVKHIRTELADKRHRQHSLPVEHALGAAIEKLDALGAGNPLLPLDVGSTACMVMLTADDAWFVNVGDSRGIIRTRGGQVRQMTVDHKPMLKTEADRVVHHGGFMSNKDGSWRINGRLNLSRAIGDWSMRPFVIPTPTIQHYCRSTFGAGASRRSRDNADADEYIVLATDGLFDVMTNESIAEIIDGHPHTREGITKALHELVHMSQVRNSSDNITIIYIGLSVTKQARKRQSRQ